MKIHLISTCGPLIAALAITACGGGDGEISTSENGVGETAIQSTRQTNGHATLPTDRIDLSTAYTFIPKEKMELGECGFASLDAVNQLLKRQTENTVLETTLIEPNECVWSNAYTWSVSVTRLPITAKKSPKTDRYNLDIEPDILSLSSPGQNAVMLSDQILQGPFAVYFETEANQIQIRLLGVSTSVEKFGAFADHVANNASVIIEPPKQIEENVQPTLRPCQVLNGAHIGSVFRAPKPFSDGAVFETSSCEYAGFDADQNRLTLSISYSGNALEPQRLSAYGTPDRLDEYSVPVFRIKSGSRNTVFGIAHADGHIIITLNGIVPDDDERLSELISNLISRL